MAERRMFAKTIIDSDAFLDMPLSAQALYFHLSMRADDDGFINNPKKIQRMIGGADDDLKLLIAKKFIIPFESGIVVIKHWKIHNYIRSDRYKETVYKEEKAQLSLKENNAYSFGIPSVTQPVYQLDTQDRLVKDSLVKENINSAKEKNTEEILLSEEESKGKSKAETYKHIVSFLNEKAGTNYKYTSKATQDSINARLNEGFTIEDFETVITKKCSGWIGTEWQKFLRPSTLFGTKFESYLNEKTNGKGGSYAENRERAERAASKWGNIGTIL